MKIVKEAKEGKLTMPKVKLEGGSMEEESPMNVREKSSV